MRLVSVFPFAIQTSNSLQGTTVIAGGADLTIRFAEFAHTTTPALPQTTSKSTKTKTHIQTSGHLKGKWS